MIARLSVLCLSILLLVGCQNSDSTTQSETASASTSNIDSQLIKQTVEVACGQCQFDMDGEGCDLAVRIDGTPYYVDGVGIDDLGDAHADDGLCNCVRKADVTGQSKDGRFVAESIQLQPMD